MVTTTERPRPIPEPHYATELAEAWTVARTAQYLGITDRAVRRLCSVGRLSAYKVRGKTAQEWRVYADSAEAYTQTKSAEGRTDLLVHSDRAEAGLMVSTLAELTETMKELIAELRRARENRRPWWWPFKRSEGGTDSD